MARIKFGMMMTDARGKLGGQVFTKTRSGATVRTKVTPKNAQTQAQQTARSILGTLSTQWRGLTEGERVGWNSAVDGFSKTNIFGDVYNPSGKNLFVSLNANLATVGRPVVTSAPVPVEVPAVILALASVLLTDFSINLGISGSFPGADTFIVIQATKPYSPGRFNFSGSYATISNSAGVAFPTATALYAAYVLKYGTPTEGLKVSFRVFVISRFTGQKSVESTATCIVEG